MAKTSKGAAGSKAASKNGAKAKARKTRRATPEASAKPTDGAQQKSSPAKAGSAAARLRKARAVRPKRGTPGTVPAAAEGKLVVIGGHESKAGDMVVLREFARLVGTGKVVVATVASEVPDKLWADYKKAFAKLGLEDVHHLDVEDREKVIKDPDLELLEGAKAIFFTGGAQLRITTRLGGTALCERIQEVYARGGIIAGTSAGASVMSETMLVAGGSDESHKIGTALQLAPGLGLFKDVLVDQHFAERGRIGRLLGAVAQNPRLLGIGLDEDTAIVVDGDKRFEVIGSGAVYVVDGFEVTFTNVADEDLERTMSIFDIRLHILSQGDVFDLQARQATPHPAVKVERRLDL
jgi:cyanophycinase